MISVWMFACGLCECTACIHTFYFIICIQNNAFLILLNIVRYELCFSHSKDTAHMMQFSMQCFLLCRKNYSSCCVTDYLCDIAWVLLLQHCARWTLSCKHNLAWVVVTRSCFCNITGDEPHHVNTTFLRWSHSAI